MYCSVVYIPIEFTMKRYYFVQSFLKGQSIDAGKMKDVLFELVKVCRESKIHVVAMVSDMSSDNQALWSQLGVYANVRGDNVLVPHPVIAGEYLVLMDDTTHALKNFKQALLNYKVYLGLLNMNSI
jgi:Transposase protein